MKLDKSLLLRLLVGTVVTLASTTSRAYACDGCVMGAVEQGTIAVTSAISELGTTLQTALQSIDNDIGGIGSKIAGTQAQAANTQREMAIQIQQQGEIDQATRETQLPIDPCSTSGSNYAMQAVHTANQTASSYRPGGGSQVSSAPLQRALSGPAPAIDASRRATTSIHEANYCTAVEVQLGYPGCSTSQMPDADANEDSLFIGAGLPGKDTDLTFSPQQIEAARAYERMSVDPEPPQNISRAEAATEMGKLYIAMQKAYRANLSSAEASINHIIADRAPFPGSQQLISDINQSSAAAQQYYNANASPMAKRTGTMSLAELEDFEAGRRWRNPYWQIEFGAQADPTQLAREQLFTTAFISDMTYQSKQRQEHIEVLLGQILAELVRSHERGQLDAQLQRVHSTNAK